MSKGRGASRGDGAPPRRTGAEPAAAGGFDRRTRRPPLTRLRGAGAKLVPLALFAALAGLLYSGLQRDPGVVSSPLVGRALPAFALPGVRGGELRSEALREEPSLLNVWASWCAACRDEHPLLLRLAASGEAPIYGLNYKDERADAVRWLERFGDPYRRSGHDRAGAVGLDLGVYGVPETFIIDRKGRIAYKHIGPIAEEDWEETIRPLLRRLRGAPG